MTRRLTKDLRETILNALLKHAFAQRFNDLHRAEQELTRAVAAAAVDARYGAGAFVQAQAAPAGWLPRAHTVYLLLPSYVRERLSVSGGNTPVAAWLTDAPAPAFAHPSVCRGVTGDYLPVDALPELTKARVLGHLDARAAALDTYHKTRQQAAAALARATTVKRLLEAWPEAAPFIPAASQPVQLPAVQTDVLNAALGLPVE